MNERDALLTTAVRAVETVDGDRQSWTDEDRSWSSQAAAEAVGEGPEPPISSPAARDLRSTACDRVTPVSFAS
jgi:hypothetical protein